MSWKNIYSNLRCWSIAHSQCQCQQTLRPLVLPRRHRHTHTHPHPAQDSKKEKVEGGNPYPYPTHRQPTPHQLFHLPRNATRAEIKARYYDLVRVYHPDKVKDEINPEVAHSRFQAITAAYDVLQGKTPLDADHPRPGAGPSDLEARHRSSAAYRAMRQRRQELYSSGAVDDAFKDRLILAGVVFTIVFVILHTATTRREALAEAVNRTRNVPVHYPSQKTRTEDQRLALDTAATKDPDTEKLSSPGP